MCISLMLAQAMALFYQMAVKAQKGRSLLAKLALQVRAAVLLSVV